MARKGASPAGGRSDLTHARRTNGGASGHSTRATRAQSDGKPHTDAAWELLRTQGDASGAIHTLERVLQQAPRHLPPAWFLTMAYLDNGKPEQVRALLERMRREFERTTCGDMHGRFFWPPKESARNLGKPWMKAL
jgi:hypothetical protein